MTGVVSEFDDDAGLGVVMSDAGDAFPFHCTQISDGSRTIATGTTVTFTVNNNRPKGPEAYEVTPRS